MFDSFRLQHQGREIEIQSKQFANSLQNIRLGDFVEFDSATPIGVQGVIEDFKVDYRNHDEPYLWCVLIIVCGCFVDYLICNDQAEARRAAEVMVTLWQQPERQAEALLKFSSAHFAKSEMIAKTLSDVAWLLNQYQSWIDNSGKRPEKWFVFHWHDFDETPWDIALAKILLQMDEFRPHLHKKYVAISDNTENEEEKSRSLDK